MVRKRIHEGVLPVVQVEVLANLSLTLDGLAGVFLVLSAVTLVVALLPTLLGYWPILVIAVVHLTIVGWCFRLAWRGNWARQDISIDAATVDIRHRTARGEWRRHWPTSWVRVITDRGGSDPHVYLEHHSHRIEIGAFVPADERLQAAELIAEALRPHSAWSDQALNATASRT